MFELRQLAPSTDFTFSAKKIKALVAEIKDFNENLDFSKQLENVSGNAKVIANQIEQQVIPDLSSLSTYIIYSCYDVISNIQNMALNMYSLCNNLTAQYIDTTLLLAGIDSVKGDITNATTGIKSTLRPDLDKYDLQLNELVSKLGSEVEALSQNIEKAKHEKDQILKSMKEQKCKTAEFWKDSYERLGDNQAEFVFNTMAIGGTQQMQQNVKNYEAEISTLISYWDSLGSILSLLKEDLDMLQQMKTAQEGWNKALEMIKEDWKALNQLSS